MTTFEPGPRVVLTHGLLFRPLSSAFFARSPAAIMTDGFEVLVHEVIAASATEPWSSVKDAPSAVVTGEGLEATLGACERWWCSCSLSESSGLSPGGSDAGKDSEIVRSTRSWSTSA